MNTFFDIQPNRFTITVFLMIFFLGCGSSQDRNVNNLKNAFISWFLKTNPVRTENIVYRNQHFYWKDNSPEGREEYFDDIRRFTIELSQIDRSHVSTNSRLEYDLLSLELKKIIYELEQIRINEWDVNQFVNYLHQGLKLLTIDCGAMTVREETILKNRLNGLEEIVSHQIERYKPSQIYNLELSGQQLEYLKMDLTIFHDSCRSDSVLNEKWEIILEEVHETISNLSLFINNNTESEAAPYNFQTWENGIELLMGEGFEYNYFPYWYKQEIRSIHKEMLAISLPYFMLTHDEPVWVSYQDTLDVIKSVFKKFNSQKIAVEELVDSTRFWLNSLNRFFGNKQIFPELEFKNPTFRNSPHNENFTGEFKPRFDKTGISDYYLPAVNDSTLTLIKNELFYRTFSEIYPGKLFLSSQSNGKSKLQKLFYDEAILAAWNLYCADLLVENGFINSMTGVHLYFLHKKMIILFKIMLQHAILGNSENLKEIFTLVDKWIFDVSSHQKLIKPTFDIVTAAGYFTYIEILESRNRFTGKSNKNNNLMNFHDKFIHSGAVNFNIKQNELN